ncbi:MAG: hypothetical protein KC609_24410, partial [Myxococcales bacterium]|nr:hypothetical protein [Myxococcales bacterium]
MSTRAQRTIIDILEEANLRLLDIGELRELRGTLYSRFDMGAELAGGRDQLPEPEFPASLLYNPHLRLELRDGAAVLYLFRLDRALSIDVGWAALIDSFRRPVRSGPLLAA